MLTWESWIHLNKGKLSHIAGFEEKFITSILSNIPEVSPSDVVPQYHFTDKKGGNRYIDFMLINQTKGFCLPIELDGYEKMVGNGQEYWKFNDFLERQNAMISKFGIVLRYSNKKMLNNSSEVITEIRDTLLRQTQHKSTEDIKNKHIQELLQEYGNRQSNSDKQTALLLQELKQELSSLKNQVKNNNNTSQPSLVVKSNTTSKVMYVCLGLLILGGIGFSVYNSTAEKQVEQTNVYVPKPSPTPVETPKHYESLINNTIPLGTPPSQQLEQVEFKQELTQEAPEHKPLSHISEIAEPTPTYMVGALQKVCGNVAQISEFNKGVYLNLGDQYPRQDFTITVWNTSVDEAKHLAYTDVCVYGTVKEYKGKPQINIKSLNELS